MCRLRRWRRREEKIDWIRSRYRERSLWHACSLWNILLTEKFSSNSSYMCEWMDMIDWFNNSIKFFCVDNGSIMKTGWNFRLISSSFRMWVRFALNVTIPSHSISARIMLLFSTFSWTVASVCECVGGAAFLSHSSLSASKLCAPPHPHTYFICQHNN